MNLIFVEKLFLTYLFFCNKYCYSYNFELQLTIEAISVLFPYKYVYQNFEIKKNMRFIKKLKYEKLLKRKPINLKTFY